LYKVPFTNRSAKQTVYVLRFRQITSPSSKSSNQIFVMAAIEL